MAGQVRQGLPTSGTRREANAWLLSKHSWVFVTLSVMLLFSSFCCSSDCQWKLMILKLLSHVDSRQSCQHLTVPHYNIRDGHYIYTQDFLYHDPSPHLAWPCYVPPLYLDRWSQFLISHPDQAFATYIAQGLFEGFRIGFECNGTQMHRVSKNHESAMKKPAAVTTGIQSECSLGCLLGPIDAIRKLSSRDLRSSQSMQQRVRAN